MISRIVVLTSREIFGQYGTQETTPLIEKSWDELNSPDFDVVTFNIDTMTLAELTPKLLGADRLVITCFNYRMCKAMQYIREILKLNLSFIVHVHNLATIAFWPYRYFTSSEIFFRSDVFLTFCEADQTVLGKIFVDPISYVIPFPVSMPASGPKSKRAEIENIVYVGPISPQKNLHNLFLAYSVLVKDIKPEPPPLVLYGKEDFLGSPNMNVRNESYLDFLHELSENLNIRSHVKITQDFETSEVEKFLNEKTNLFVSASLNSEENIGVAALQALTNNNRAVLSNWGAHADIQTHFPDLTELMAVTQSEFGPALNADFIAQALKQNLVTSERLPYEALDSHYSPVFRFHMLRKAAGHEFNENLLLYSDMANTIYEAKLDYTFSPTQIFSSFDDPLFLELSKFYIKNEIPFRFDESKKGFKSVPWMTHVDEIFMIDDPHKGSFQIPNKSVGEKLFTIHFENGKDIVVDKKLIERLYKCAYINHLIS